MIWPRDYREEIQPAIREGLELGASELQVQRFNHSATLPPPISLACSRPFALLCISRRSPPGLRCINARKRLKSEILDLNPKGDHICLICRVALLTLIFVVVVVFLITEGVISIKQVNDFILFSCYQVSQIQVGKRFMTQLHLMWKRCQILGTLCRVSIGK